MSKWTSKPRRVREAIMFHAWTKENRCPECNGTARTPDGKWCKACGVTGIRSATNGEEAR
jgi:DnaJ-class molecular chaperone